MTIYLVTTRISVGSLIAEIALCHLRHRGFCRQCGSMGNIPCRGSPAWCVG